jgi:pimeloyl-ACP methyl ester carboxylesterase
MVLLHGIGHRWQGWTPVLDSLARDHDVLALDLPGFGDSPPAPEGVALVDYLPDRIEAAMDELGWDKAHLVGNSLGGWISFELAKRGRALSVTGLAPAGLWPKGSGQRHVKAWFWVWANGGKVLAMVDFLFRVALVRTLALFPLFGRPWKIPGQMAIDDLHAFGTPQLQRTMRAADGNRFEGGQGIPVPVTVAWCQFDPLFRARWAKTEELPASTTFVELAGCGHVPMWDDPDAVLRTIRTTAAKAA